MYLSRAENLITYWASEAKSGGASSTTSMRDLAAKFGGRKAAR